MLATIGKNLWILVTILIPGLFTYGTWRLLLILHPSQAIDVEALKMADQSGTVTLSIIMALALLQQAVGILIELVFALFAKIKEHSWTNFFSLFWGRFSMADTGETATSVTLVIGNLFLSINNSVGLVILIVYFSFFESLDTSHWIIKTLVFFLVAHVFVVIFRLFCALKAVDGHEKNKPAKHAGEKDGQETLIQENNA